MYEPLFQNDQFSGLHVFAGQQIETDDDDDDFANYLDGPRLQAKLTAPTSLVENESGDVFFREGVLRRIRMVSSGGLVSTFAGGGQIDGDTHRDGIGRDALLCGGGPMTIGTNGLLYLVDHKFLRSVNRDGAVTTLDRRMMGVSAICAGAGDHLFFTRSDRDAGERGMIRSELCRYDLERHDPDVLFRTDPGESLGGVVSLGSHVLVAGCGRVYSVEVPSAAVSLVADGLDLYFEHARSIDADDNGNLFLGGRWPIRVDAVTGQVNHLAQFANDTLGSNASVLVKRHAPYRGHLLVATRHVIFVTDSPVLPWDPERFEGFNRAAL